MNQMNNGESQLEQRLDELLSNYESRLYLGSNSAPACPLSTYLKTNAETLQKYTPEQCIEISLELISYGVYIQREVNRERARISWFNNYIAEVCGKEWANYDQYMPKEYKIQAIAEEHPILQKVLKAKATADALVASSDNLQNLVKYYADLYAQYAKLKRYNN